MGWGGSRVPHPIQKNTRSEQKVTALTLPPVTTKPCRSGSPTSQSGFSIINLLGIQANIVILQGASNADRKGLKRKLAQVGHSLEPGAGQGQVLNPQMKENPFPGRTPKTPHPIFTSAKHEQSNTKITNLHKTNIFFLQFLFVLQFKFIVLQHEQL